MSQKGHVLQGQRKEIGRKRKRRKNAKMKVCLHVLVVECPLIAN